MCKSITALHVLEISSERRSIARQVCACVDEVTQGRKPWGAAQRIRQAAATLFSLGAPTTALAAPALAGHYQVNGFDNVRSHLLLNDDGRFEYMMLRESYSEFARGTWRRDGEWIVLDSEDDKHASPRFILKRTERRPGRGIAVRVKDRAARGVAGIDVTLEFDAERQETGTTMTGGFEYPLRDNRMPPLLPLSDDGSLDIGRRYENAVARHPSLEKFDTSFAGLVVAKQKPTPRFFPTGWGLARRRAEIHAARQVGQRANGSDDFHYLMVLFLLITNNMRGTNNVQ